MNEEIEGDKHLIALALPGEEKEPKMLVTWQYIWDDSEGRPLICVLFSNVRKDGTEEPRRFSLLGDTSKGTAKECLDLMVAGMEKELEEICKEEEATIAVVDRNPKRPMGFLVDR